MIICFNGLKKRTQAGIHGAPQGKSREGTKKTPLPQDPLHCSSLQTSLSGVFWMLGSHIPSSHSLLILLQSHLHSFPTNHRDPVRMCFLVSSLLCGPPEPVLSHHCHPLTLTHVPPSPVLTTSSSPSFTPALLLMTPDGHEVASHNEHPLKTPFCSLKHRPSLLWLSAVVSSLI